ncbi:EF-hand domain-containing protein [Frigidibacter sp. ROC022]|uniref:EF-hand domain-containing protein n=1 Tax=Frigidibacter sp. ROC022 TaxID=2971796 RepID=UPI00215B3472|nr:EF-hand domain-containing protein [Frigidibacter sp. ROC022]MCR8725447.1 EF-hand domain-containing protein [Frigidibacter sp. ROC022]
MTKTKLVSALAVFAVLGTALASTAQEAGPKGPGMGGRDGGPMAGMVWEQLDANADGVVTSDELAAAAKARFDAADTDGDGFISQDEMVAAAEAREAERRAARRAEMAQRMFDRQDDNADGKLSADEMRVARAGEGFLKRFDADGDGSVSKAEYDDGLAKMAGKMGKRGSKGGHGGKGGHGERRGG